MRSSKQDLLRDALIFLQENFSSNTQFFISSTYPKKCIQQPSITIPAACVTLPVPKITKEKSISLSYDDLPPKKIEKKPPSIPKPIIEKTSIIQAPLVKEKPSFSYTVFKKSVERLFPHFVLKDTPLTDGIADAMTNTTFLSALQANVLLFSFKDMESELFLQNVQKAITQYHTSAHIFYPSTCQGEEELSFFLQNMQAKLIIAPHNLVQKKEFLPFLRELPVSSELFLGGSRLLILEPFTNYFTSFQKKKNLWHTLCTLLPSLATPALS